MLLTNTWLFKKQPINKEQTNEQKYQGKDFQNGT